MSLTNAVLLFLLFASFSLDIWWTITIDIQLEQQRLDAMVDSIINLINKWTAEGAIPKKVSDKSNKKLQRKMKDLNKTLEDEYKEECRELSKRLSTQNKVSIKEDIICASKILNKINNTISEVIERDRLKLKFDINRDELKALKPEINVLMINLDEQGEEEESYSILNMILGFSGAILIYFFIFSLRSAGNERGHRREDQPNSGNYYFFCQAVSVDDGKDFGYCTCRIDSVFTLGNLNLPDYSWCKKCYVG